MGVAAQLLAATARFGAGAAVGVMQVLLADAGTGVTRGGAGGELKRNDWSLGLPDAAEHASGGATGVGAVEVHANAVPEHFDIVFSQAGVGAGGAR